MKQEHDLDAASSVSNPPVFDLSFSNLHNFLLISDTALPLGSFAYSAGLESFLAHRAKSAHGQRAFIHFLQLSLASVAGLTLPYVITAYEQPAQLEELDNDLDASLACTVARRASVQQGKALLTVWERSFRLYCQSETPDGSLPFDARATIDTFHSILKAGVASSHPDPNVNPLESLGPNGHLPPLFGVICAALAIPLRLTIYTYLLNHVKMVVSAGIRAGVLGPYQAQAVLASKDVRDSITRLVDSELRCEEPLQRRKPVEATQNTPILDIWGGRHEILYSRVFNS